MFKNEMKTRMMAFAVVAMFMVTAFSVGSINTDATEDGTLANPYIIYITENDQFSYTPTVNLSENTTLTAMQGTESNAINTALSMTTNNDSGLTFSGTTLSATSIKYGIWYVQIHASWSLTVHGTVLSQTADQYIIFYVSHDLSIVASDNKVTFALDEHSLHDHQHFLHDNLDLSHEYS